MNSFRRLFLASFMIALGTTSAQAAMITSTFSGGNGNDGAMFDVVTLGGALNVTGFDLNLDKGTWDVEVYKKNGTWDGFENNATAWTLIDSAALTSTDEGTATYFDVNDFMLEATSTSALYITAKSGGVNYTNGTGVGSVYAANSDLQILEGVGKGYAFGATFDPRVWNGSIYYEATSSSSVPEPASVILLGLGLAGLGLSRKRKQA